MGVDYTGFAHPKGASRVEDRKATVAAEKKAEKQAKAATWKRDGSKCRCCGKHVQRGLDSLQAGHVHHLTYRSHGGTWDVAGLILTCATCHDDEHQGRLTVTAKTKRGADGPLQVVRRKAREG